MKSKKGHFLLCLPYAFIITSALDIWSVMAMVGDEGQLIGHDSGVCSTQPSVY